MTLEQGRRPGEGPNRCRKQAKRGPCGNWEVDGLEYCVQHMPDDLLDEAEDVVGIKRCRKGFGTPESCPYIAVSNTDPPRCKNHGANIGGVISKHAITRGIEISVTDRVAEIMAANGRKLLQPDPVEDPFTELLTTAAEIRAFKEIMRDQVNELIARRSIRYESKQAGEQLRVEILVYERALDRLVSTLAQIARLNISERLAGIRAVQLRMLEQALDQALEASGVGIDGKLEARRAFRQNVVVIQGELTG